MENSAIFITISAVALAAAIWDLKFRKVPNLITFGLIISAFLFHGLHQDLSASLTGFGAGFMWFFVPYMLGGIGAGDVKLLSGICAWVCWPLALYVIIWSSLAGAATVLILMLDSEEIKSLWLSSAGGIGSVAKDLINTTSRNRKRKTPYAPAIAAGTIIALLLT